MKSMNMDQLLKIVQTGLKPDEVILDVREVDEFKEGHIPGSSNFPLSTLETKIADLKKFSTIYVHCQRGGRAQKATALMQSKGITQLVCVSDGGFENWKTAGFPIEK